MKRYSKCKNFKDGMMKNEGNVIFWDCLHSKLCHRAIEVKNMNILKWKQFDFALNSKKNPPI